MEQSEQIELKVADLDKEYNDGESVDKAHFASQRTAHLLYKGDHFKKKASQFLERNGKNLSENSKIKISENHTAIIVDRTKANIINQSPGVIIAAHNENERQDRKAAELCNSVKETAEQKLKYHEKLEKWVDGFVVAGECFSLNYFDPNAGDVIGYRQKTNAVGEPLWKHPVRGEVPKPTDEMGQPLEMARSKNPVFRGMIKKEVIPAHDVIRHKSAKSIDESPWLCVRKMLSNDEAKALVPANAKNREDILKEIKANCEKTYQLFESNGEYKDSKDQCLVKYWFWRKCYKYPEGYFAVQIGQNILSQGPLPFGVWPIAYAGFKTTEGSPRATGKVEAVRHAQTHLNFLISNEAFHIVALGDDKVYTQMGTKLTQGSSYNGIRSYMTNGPAPVIQPGRDASQFERKIDRQVSTIYRLGDIEYETQETKVQDPLALLYSSLKNRLKHAHYAEKFGRFLCEDWEIYLELARHYMDDDEIIKCVGKREAINIAEFKATQNSDYKIKAKEVSGTLEEQLGQYLNAREILQYVGKNLPPQVLAKIINNLPFLSKERIADDMLITDRNIENDILAMDRGEFRPAFKDDEHDQYIPRLKSHMKTSEFKTLDPQIQQMYQQKYQEHVNFASELLQEKQRAEQGLIPTGGGQVKFDLLDEKGKRMSADVASVQWFLQQLKNQGITQDMMQQMDRQTQNEILMKAFELAPQLQQQGMGQPVGMQQVQPMPPIA